MPASEDAPAERHHDPPGVTADPEAALFDRAAQARTTLDLEDARVHSTVKARLFGAPARPLRIQRFTLLEQIGRGGAGEVWSAYDPRLDRRVAIKVLHEQSKGNQAAARLLREAQITGRLSHPNIVSVFEVGLYEDRLWLAMEFIEGPNLGQWLTQAPRTAREILDAFEQAGQGLAEAHRHDIVHRDFKPANVMLQLHGRGPRARVVDFGLARGGTQELATPQQAGETPPDGTLPDTRSITRTGQRMGTPAYMAPEQLAGELADARSDQFAFCVALVEALAGSRPSRRAGDFRIRPEVMARVPSRLRAPLRRGLSVDPQARWPGMDALLAAITPKPRRRGLALVLVALAAGGAAVIAVDAGSPCQLATDRLAGWPDARREAIERALQHSELPMAGDTWTRVEPHLDEFVAHWRQTDRTICEARRSGRMSDAVHDRARACLGHAEHRFDTLLHRLQSPTVAGLEAGVSSAADLLAVDRCADPTTPELGLALPAEPELLAAVDRGRRHLIEAQDHWASGNTERGLERVELARAQLEPGRAPLFDAELTLASGRGLLAKGQLTEASEALLEAFGQAEANAHDGVKLDAAVYLAQSLQTRDPGRAQWWSSVAVSVAERVDPEGAGMIRALHQAVSAANGAHDGPRETLNLRRMTALIETSWPGREDWWARARVLRADRALRQGQLDEALADAESARSAFARALGPLSPRVGETEILLGTIHRQREDFERARVHYQRALELWTQTRGASHPWAASVKVQLATLADVAGDLAGAEALYTEALRVIESTSGHDAVRVSTVLENLAIVYARQGELERAQVTFARALAITEERLGPEHPTTAFSHHNLATMLNDAGRPAQALPHARHAVEVRRRALGSAHPKLGLSLLILADSQHALGELERAAATLDEAITVLEAAHGPSDPAVMRALKRRARHQLEAGRPQLALADLRRAVAIDDAAQGRGDPHVSASVRFALAQQLEAQGDPAALALAEQAHERLLALGEAGAQEAQEVGRWLAQRGSG